MKDMFEKEIMVGDRIAYPGRAGSCMWMTWAIVAEVLADGLMVRVHGTRLTKIRCMNRCVVVNP